MTDDQTNDLTLTLQFLESLVVSLDKIGSYSAANEIDSAKLVDSFIDEYDIFRKAAEARDALSHFFNDEIPEGEEMSELEKLLEDVAVWSAPAQ